MKSPVKKIILKTLKWSGITLGSLIALLFLLPYLFPQIINRKINQWANSNINGNISFSRTRLSFFKHFPSFTLTLYDVTLMGSAPFEKDTLIAAKAISLGLDLSSVFKSKITINKVFLNDAFINVQVDSAGNANYNVYKHKQRNNKAPADTGGASLGIRKILVENCRLVYNDRSLPMLINARGFNYTGSGDLSQDVFELNTHMDIQSLDFYYNKSPYILSKKINADLITQVNTKSLSFIFRKNTININQLPVEFNGRFGFLKDGYDMNFNIGSRESSLDEIVSALPTSYQQLLDKTDISGTGDIQIALAGKYVVKDSLMPGITMSVKVRNGYIDNQKSPAPLRNLYIDMEAKLPSLSPDSLTVNIDSLHFNIADGYFNSVFKLKGITEPDIYAKINAEIDLEKWNKAIGVRPFEVKGRYSLHLLAEGKYAKGVVYGGGLRKKVDTVITSIPKFTLRSSFRGGYFKYASLPQAVKDISFNLRANCPDNNYKHISLALDSLNASALGDYVRGYFKLEDLSNFSVDAALQAKFNLADLKQFYPVDSLELAGDLNADIRARGAYLPAKKKYPVMVAKISMQNGSVKTKYYPNPIENIQVTTNITDRSGSLKGLNVSIQPISFSFENEPFLLKAELHDFTDLAYNIDLKGNLNIGSIYQVFAQKGYGVTGTVAANLSLKGRESDVTAKRYDKLFNRGSLTVKDIKCTTELYPQPFIISRGVFRFNRDKMELDALTVNYAHSTFVLNGAVSNVIDYAMKPGAVLKGNLNLASDLLVIDDFMAFSASPQPAATPAQTTTGGASGVVLAPKGLDLGFTADIKKIKYNDLVIADAKGQMMLKNDSILLRETGFTLVGAPVTMDAAYTSISPQKAYFSYHISATDFDIHKAYKSIKLFRDIATSAEHAEGLVSLDYQLSGALDNNMRPIYPSLKGGGVLSAKKLQMHGFKLFNAIGKEAKQDSLGSNAGLSKIALKTTIANNIITLERTKMRIAGFRVRMEGQAAFSKELNLKFRLGLPPLGLIGIPMTITGTEDNPKIHIGKGKDADELKGTTDDSRD